ncbi:hypothetical protein [Curtobacterium sp. MCSS17_016]|uniref:hypothetical protein n=1 Tax=Curtobacterium sp. MCSS17_016 TaxID=2175644 RepID=UPI000DA7246D|nr:hypothetical protein [Curtobacterium sp. MCSS17_016]WIE80884.1 hypothetical protein DEJ19_020420 [Curtobacterium sp. MCSS17_016]
MRSLLRSDRAATDPILVIAAIAVSLVLLVGGSFTATSIINNGRDTNARGDLDKVATMQTTLQAQQGTYAAYDSAASPRLDAGSLTFTPSGDTRVVVATCSNGWAAAARSASGRTYVRTSERNTTLEAPAASAKTPTCMADPAAVSKLIQQASAGLVQPAGTTTTFAGQPQVTGSLDGDKNTATLGTIYGVAADQAGHAFLADQSNKLIREVAPDGSVTTLAGIRGSVGLTDGAKTVATFECPYALTTDPYGNVYVSEDCFGRAQAVRKVTPDGTVTTLAGGATAGYEDGPGTTALLNGARGLTITPDGSIYVAEFNNSDIRKISPDGTVSTFAGQPGVVGYQDGPARTALFNHLRDITSDRDGNLYVVDQDNARIRKITPAGDVTTIAGNGTGAFVAGPALSSGLAQPVGVAADGAGNVYVLSQNAGYITKITPTGTMSLVAGGTGAGYADGPNSSAKLNSPVGIASDWLGNVYTADKLNYVIRRTSQ